MLLKENLDWEIAVFQNDTCLKFSPHYTIMPQLKAVLNAGTMEVVFQKSIVNS